MDDKNLMTCPLCRGEGECDRAIGALKREPKPPLTDNELFRTTIRAIALGVITLILTIAIYNYMKAEPVIECSNACGEGNLKSWTHGFRNDDGKFTPEKCECLKGDAKP